MKRKTKKTAGIVIANPVKQSHTLINFKNAFLLSGQTRRSAPTIIFRRLPLQLSFVFILTAFFILSTCVNNAYSAIYTISPGHSALTNDNGDDGNSPGGAGTTPDPAWAAWSGTGVTYYNQFACQRDTVAACTNIYLHNAAHTAVVSRGSCSTTPTGSAYCLAGNTVYHCNVDGTDSGDSFTTEGTAPATTDNANSTWRISDFAVTLSPSDGGSGMSGCAAGTWNCIDTTGTCTTSNAGSTPNVTCTAGTTCASQYVRYYSKDALGNTEAWKTSLIIKIDKQAPTFSVTDGAIGSWNTSDTITVSPSDNSGSGLGTTYYGYSADATCDGSDTITTAGASVVVNTTHTDYVCFKNTDTVGNVGYSSAIGPLYVDVTAPSLSLTSHTAGTTYYVTSSITVNGTAADSNSGLQKIQYQVNAGAWTDISTVSPWSKLFDQTSLLTQDTGASITLNFKSLDNIGNSTVQTIYVRFKPYDKSITSCSPTAVVADNTDTITCTERMYTYDVNVANNYVRLLVNYLNGASNDNNERGYFMWYPTAPLTDWTNQVSCTGGGYGFKYGLDYGYEYSTLTGCSVTKDAANNYIDVSFTWKVNNTVGSSVVGGITLQTNDTNTHVRQWADDGTAEIGWEVEGDYFDILPAAPTIGTATANSTTQITWSWTVNSGNVEDGFRVHDASNVVNVSAAVDATSVQEGSLTANTQYTRHVHAYNASTATRYDSPATGNGPGSGTVSKYTLPVAPNITCSRTPHLCTVWGNGSTFAFTNAAGWAAGQLNHYHYKWNQTAVDTAGAGDTTWSSGTLAKIATANGAWYLHVLSHNPDENSGGTTSYGPYYYEGTAPNAIGLLDISQSISGTVSNPNSATVKLSWTGVADSGGSGMDYYLVEIEQNGAWSNSGGISGCTSGSNPVTTDSKKYHTGLVTHNVWCNNMPGNTTYKGRVTATDWASNTTATTSVAWYSADTTPPTISSVSINSGATSTNVFNVLVTINTSDYSPLQYVYVSNSTFDPAAVSWTTPYSQYVSWSFPNNGEGSYTVYVAVKDIDGNYSTVSNDSINIDFGYVNNMAATPTPFSPGESPNVKDTTTITGSVHLKGP